VGDGSTGLAVILSRVSQPVSFRTSDLVVVRQKLLACIRGTYQLVHLL